MVDKSEIFAALTARNALRREAGLPLLNLRRELAHEVALAEAHEATEFAEQFGDERLRIREQVIADLREQKGAEFGHTMGGRWAINHTTNLRFRDFLRDQHGIEAKTLTPRNAIVYGEGASAVLVEVPVEEKVEAEIINLFGKS